MFFADGNYTAGDCIYCGLRGMAQDGRIAFVWGDKDSTTSHKFLGSSYKPYL